MSFIKKIEVLSMAFDRSDWIAKARHRLEGALGEYAKLRYAKMIGFDFDWSDEVTALMKKVLELFDPKKTKLKKWKDVDKAFTEAYYEAASAHEQLVAAKNQFISNWLCLSRNLHIYLKPKDAKAFLLEYKKSAFTPEGLMQDMLTEFAPELKNRLKK